MVVHASDDDSRAQDADVLPGDVAVLRALPRPYKLGAPTGPQRTSARLLTSSSLNLGLHLARSKREFGILPRSFAVVDHSRSVLAGKIPRCRVVAV